MSCDQCFFSLLFTECVECFSVLLWCLVIRIISHGPAASARTSQSFRRGNCASDKCSAEAIRTVHQGFYVPFDISILTIQPIVRQLAILHFHATMALAPKGNPKSPRPSVLLLTMTHYPSSSQNRSPILTAISPFFRTQSPCTLDPIQSTSIVYTISPMLDGNAINY